MQVAAVVCLRSINNIISERLILSIPTCSEVGDRSFCSFTHFNVLFECGFLSVVNMKNSSLVSSKHVYGDG
jgi:hypothetical protein